MLYLISFLIIAMLLLIMKLRFGDILDITASGVESIDANGRYRVTIKPTGFGFASGSSSPPAGLAKATSGAPTSPTLTLELLMPTAIDRDGWAMAYVNMPPKRIQYGWFTWRRLRPLEVPVNTIASEIAIEAHPDQTGLLKVTKQMATDRVSVLSTPSNPNPTGVWAWMIESGKTASGVGTITIRVVDTSGGVAGQELYKKEFKLPIYSHFMIRAIRNLWWLLWTLLVIAATQFANVTLFHYFSHSVQ